MRWQAIALWCVWVNIIFPYSFQDALTAKEERIEIAIGRQRLSLIKNGIKNKEISRVTELLLIDGIGEKTVHKVSEIIGTRFHYLNSAEICY